jgi:hypothetical protein
VSATVGICFLGVVFVQYTHSRIHHSCCRSYNEARRRLSAEQDREIERKDKKLKDEDARLKELHQEELKKIRLERLSEITPDEVNDLFHNELTPAKLRSFSKMMDDDVIERRNALSAGFSKFRDLLIDYDMMRKWYDRFQADFPYCCQSQLATVLPYDHEGPVDEKKEYQALWRFVAGIRARSTKYCKEIAAIFTLSQMSTTVGDKTIKLGNHLGNMASKSSAERTMKLINDLNSKPWDFLGLEKTLGAGFDNMQYNMAQKMQNNGKSTYSIDGTSRYFRKVTPFVPPERLPFTTNEGQPGATFKDQLIPAPIGMPPLECMDKKKFEKLLSREGGMRQSLQGETFQQFILESPPVTEDFDMSKMEATDGSRSAAYLGFLRRTQRYKALWQFLSTEKTIKSTGHPIGPVTAQAWEVFTIINNARQKELKSARDFQREVVRTWFPEMEEETLTFLHSVSVFTEKTTEGTGKVLVELLLDAGLLYVDNKDKIQLADDWEERVVFMCGDAYSVNNGYRFASLTETSVGRYSDSYEMNMNISKALSRMLWFPGDLHVEFHMCKAIYVMYYPGFLHSFQACAQVTRLIQDSTKCFQLSKTFLRLVYEQVYRRIAICWWCSLPKDHGITTVHEAVTAFEAHLDSMWLSKDEVHVFLARFMDLCEVYFLFSDCVECQDSIGQELVLTHFQPIFYFLGMTNYKEVTWREHEMMYSRDRPLLDRETIRRNRTILLNKGKHAIGADTFCELLNGKIVTMKKSKTIEKCSERSSAITVISHSDAFVRKFVCEEDVDSPPKSSTKKRTAYIRDRISELISVGCLLVEQEGRKIKDVDLYAPLDDLKTCLRVAPTDEDKEDDEITLAEVAVTRRNDTISTFVEGIMPKKGDDARTEDAVEDVEMEDSTDERSSVASRPKKILLENGKIRIGTSHQERMKIDPKNVATKDPFVEGKKLIAKDKVAEKREQKKQVHERKKKLAQMCYVQSRLEEQALVSLDDIEPYPVADRHEAIVAYDEEFSPWH